MNRNLNKISLSLVFKFVVVGGLLFALSIAIYSDYRINNEPVSYTIATITKFTRGGRTGPWFNLEFSVNGDKYEAKYSNLRKLGLEGNAFLKTYVGRKFLIKYNRDDVGLNRLMLECPVPDSIEVAPPQGWEKRPFKCNEEIE